MTASTETTETTETTTDNRVEPDTEQGDAQEVEDATGDDRPGAEAARYRRRLRETETERDGISERLTGYQRREAERLAAATLSRPADLWLDGAEVGDLLDDEGQLDPEKVAATVAGVLTDRPQLEAGRVRPRPDHAQGGTGAATAHGWGDVLRGRKA